tara:strand:- start:418 stop:1086 length:669 start_codon:yes stop_codon:yes gene_type:complete
MAKIICMLFTIGLIHGQVAEFNFSSNKTKEQKSIVYYTSFWLSEALIINPMNKSRLTVSFGQSISIPKINNRHWFLPNFDFGYKVTENLALTSKIYGFVLNHDQPQVFGSGVQYFFGDEKSSIFSINKSDLKGLKDFRLSCLTLNIQKSKKWSDILITAGIGSNFFKEVTYGDSIEISRKIEGRINFLSLILMKQAYGAVWGGSLKLHPQRQYISWFIQKNF